MSRGGGHGRSCSFGSGGHSAAHAPYAPPVYHSRYPAAQDALSRPPPLPPRGAAGQAQRRLPPLPSPGAAPAPLPAPSRRLPPPLPPKDGMPPPVPPRQNAHVSPPRPPRHSAEIFVPPVQAEVLAAPLPALPPESPVPPPVPQPPQRIATTTEPSEPQPSERIGTALQALPAVPRLDLPPLPPASSPSPVGSLPRVPSWAGRVSPAPSVGSSVVTPSPAGPATPQSAEVTLKPPVVPAPPSGEASPDLSAGPSLTQSARLIPTQSPGASAVALQPVGTSPPPPQETAPVHPPQDLTPELADQPFDGDEADAPPPYSLEAPAGHHRLDNLSPTAVDSRRQAMLQSLPQGRPGEAAPAQVQARTEETLQPHPEARPVSAVSPVSPVPRETFPVPHPHPPPVHPIETGDAFDGVRQLVGASPQSPAREHWSASLPAIPAPAERLVDRPRR